MGFNNGLERVRLENQWKKLRAQYRAAGMSEDAIQAMYEFDLRVVNSEQTYGRSTFFPSTWLTTVKAARTLCR